jgi:hypothetical protein
MAYPVREPLLKRVVNNNLHPIISPLLCVPSLHNLPPSQVMERCIGRQRQLFSAGRHGRSAMSPLLITVKRRNRSTTISRTVVLFVSLLTVEQPVIRLYELKGWMIRFARGVPVAWALAFFTPPASNESASWLILLNLVSNPSFFDLARLSSFCFREGHGVQFSDCVCLRDGGSLIFGIGLSYPRMSIMILEIMVAIVAVD